MFRKLDLFVLKSYIGPFIATFCVSVFLLLMQFLWRYIDDLVGKGLDFLVIGELLFYASAALVPMSLPLATLLASIMTFGNLGEYNELMAMKAAGVPLKRIMMPLVLLNVLIAVLAFFFSNNVLPYTNLRMGALLYDVRQQRPELNIKEGIFYNGIDGTIMKIKGKNPKTKMMYDVVIYDHRGQIGNLNVVIADSAQMIMTKDKQFLFFTLYSGERYEEVREEGRYNRAKMNFPHQRQKFSEQKIVFELSGFQFSRSSTELFKDNYQMLNLSQLQYSLDSLKKEYAGRLNYMMERNITGFMYKYLDKRRGKLDSIINPDLVFKNYDEAKKLQTISLALDELRNSKHAFSISSDDLNSRRAWLSRFEIEWHRKFTLSVACLILFFIGAPFGAIVRKGGLGMPVVISVVFFLFYYIFSMMGEKSVKSGEVIAVQGMWLAPLILLPLGIYFSYRATHDATLLNIDPLISLYSFIKSKISRTFKSVLREREK